MNNSCPENSVDQQDKTADLPSGLFFSGRFSSFRVFFWYFVIYLAFCLIASFFMNRSVSDGNQVISFGYISSFVFGFIFLIENRFRWFNGRIISFSFGLCLILWAIFSVVLAHLFLINTMFIGGLP
jgi:hypothetical protein